MTAPEPLDLPQVQQALDAVLGEYGPDQLTDGVHGYLSWLKGLVDDCLKDDSADGA